MPNASQDMPPEGFPATPGAAAQVQYLTDEIAGLRDIITNQQEQIQALLAATSQNSAQPGPSGSTGPSNPPRRPSSSTRPPQIPAYTGGKDDQTSMKVKSFIYNVRQVATLSGLDDMQCLGLAECYLQDRAAMWMMSLERDDAKPTSIDALQSAMIREFVPPDERARAKTRLMTLKLTGSVDSYVSKFRDLIDICGTPLSEASLFFFTGLSDIYKEEFTKKYPTGSPPSIQEVYEHARTIELALQWNSNRHEKPSRHDKRHPPYNGKRRRAGSHRLFTTTRRILFGDLPRNASVTTTGRPIAASHVVLSGSSGIAARTTRKDVPPLRPLTTQKRNAAR